MNTKPTFPRGMLMRRTLLVLTTLVWTSCGSGDGGNGQEVGPDDSTLETADTTTGDDAPVEPGSDVSPDGGDRAADSGDILSGTFNMTGTWAEWEVGASITQVPVLGETHTLGVAVMRWVVTQEGETLAMRQELCGLTLLSDSDLATTVVPTSFITSVPVMDKTGTVALGDNGLHFTMDLTPELYGVTLEDPLSETLPTTVDDPRVFDQDNDGHPGMTVFITGILDCAAFVVQRNLRSLAGTFVNGDRIEGLMDWTQDQNILGSDNEILAANHPTSKTDPDASKSRFVVIRIPEDRDCAWLMAHQDELFPKL